MHHDDLDHEEPASSAAPGRPQDPPPGEDPLFTGRRIRPRGHGGPAWIRVVARLADRMGTDQATWPEI